MTKIIEIKKILDCCKEEIKAAKQNIKDTENHSNKEYFRGLQAGVERVQAFIQEEDRAKKQLKEDKEFELKVDNGEFYQNNNNQKYE